MKNLLENKSIVLAIRTLGWMSFFVFLIMVVCYEGILERNKVLVPILVILSFLNTYKKVDRLQ